MPADKTFAFGFQSERDAGFPPLVQLALMHYICNSRCLKCPVGLYNRGEMGQDNKGEFDPEKRRFFPFGIFQTVAVEMGKHPWSILRFHGRGEPLMHPDYVKMIEFAKKSEVGTVTSFTNAILLDQKMAESILMAGMDLLELSIDAASDSLYRQFRGTGYFNLVVRNANAFILARNRLGCKTRVIVSAVDCPEFQPEKEQFREYWSSRADMVIFRPYHTYGGRLPAIKSCMPDEIVPCAQLWTRFSINPWGQVNACFNDWADEEIVGDLNEPDASIAGIWRDRKFEGIREASLRRRSILKCCGTCLASMGGWNYSYQLLLEKLMAAEPNTNLK